MNSLGNNYVSTPQQHIIREISPACCHELGDNHWFVDFGKAAFGTIKITGEAMDDVNLTVHLGEALDSEGRLNRSPRGSIRYRKVECIFSRGTRCCQIEIPPDQRNTNEKAVKMPEELFEVLPFRYVEIISSGRAFKLDKIIQLAVQYPFSAEVSFFECSDSEINAVWDLCRHSIIATSFAPVYVDGDRERIAYEGDTYINQLGHYCLDNDYQLARKTIEYLLFNPTWPTEWQLFCVPMAWLDYLYSGETVLLSTYYEVLRNKTLLALSRPDGLITTHNGLSEEFLDSINLKEPLRDLVDWPPGSFTEGGTGERDNHEMKPINTVVNAFHYWNLILFSKIADVLGYKNDKILFAERVSKIAPAFKKLFSYSKGSFTDGEDSCHCSLHSSMFPAAFGLVSPEFKGMISEFLKNKGMACSVYGAQFLLDALYCLGEQQYALDLMRQDSDRSWLGMIKSGSTITMEAWDWKYKNNLDWNHAWGAAPANIIPRWVVGVTPEKPGFQTILVAPQPGDLEWFKSKVPVNGGYIRVEYYRNKLLKIDLQVDDLSKRELIINLKGLKGKCEKVIVNNKKYANFESIKVDFK